MKMLLKRNLLENITIISNCGTIFCILLHYLTDISLLAGKWFLLYILAVFFVSAFFSFRAIQWLLRLNKPICYNLDAIVAKYPYLAILRGFLPELPKPAKQEWKEYDTNELSVISTVLERKLVSSWYVPHISQEIGFPFACKQMLDQMIGRAFQICSNIETKDVFVDISTILISHLKEYEKAVKRHEKSPSSSIESHYKKSHSISSPNNKYTSVEHCTNVLRIMMKELLPWELRDTPHSELLVRILSKRLDSFIVTTLADPVWLNDKLMTYLTGEEYIEVKKEEYLQESTKPPEEVVEKEEVETDKVAKTVELMKEELVEVKEDCVGKTEVPIEEGVMLEPQDVRSSPVLRQRRGRQGRSEVKIYDRIIEGSVKTWETDMDLQCISMGQDLLASLDGEITLSRLWGHEDPDRSPDAGGKSPQPPTGSSSGSEELLETEAHTSPRQSPKRISQTAAGAHPQTAIEAHPQTAIEAHPQTAMAAHLHTIVGSHPQSSQGGYVQGALVGHPQTAQGSHTQAIDAHQQSPGGQSHTTIGAHSETAQESHPQTVVMSHAHSAQAHLLSTPGGHSSPGGPQTPGEALLALQASVSHAKHKIGDLQVKEIDVSGASDEAAGMMEGLLDYGIAGLKKGLRFTGLSDDSQDKSPSHGRDRSDKSPPLEWTKVLPDAHAQKEENGNGVPHLVKQHRVTSQDSMPSAPRAPPPSESPEPQYEEAADLSTSIAKLRRLLRQRAEAAPRDPAPLPDPAPPSAPEVWWEGAEETRGRTARAHASRPVDCASLADEYDMSMERNSPNQTSNNMQRLDKLFQRTVTGVFNSLKTAVGGEDAAPPHAQQWAYVHTSNELSVCVVAARLAWARRARGVDAALDSLALHAPPPAAPPAPEDLDEWLALHGRAWCAGAGLCAPLRSHVAHRLASLLLAGECLVADEWLALHGRAWCAGAGLCAPHVAHRLASLLLAGECLVADEWLALHGRAWCAGAGLCAPHVAHRLASLLLAGECLVADEWLALHGRACCAGAGLCAPHVALRLASLLLADAAESLFTYWLSALAGWLRAQVFLAFSRAEEGAAPPRRPLDEDATVAAILEHVPALTALFGEDTASAWVRRAVGSVGGRVANRDVAYRVLDLLVLHFKNAAGVRNPSFDNN